MPDLTTNYGFKIPVAGESNYYSSMEYNLETIDTMISDIGINSTPPNNYQTISQAYPTVTLAQVQALNASATLSDSAGWYYLQSIFTAKQKQYWVSKAGTHRINIPQGNYKLSRALDLSNLGNTFISFYGSMLIPFDANYTGYLVEITEGYGRTFIDGMYIRGMWITKGLNIDEVQHIGFNNLMIDTCFIGLRVARVWYANLSGQCKISNCMTHVLFDVVDAVNTGAEEINTMSFINLDISGASDTDFTNFGKTKGVDLVYGFYIKCRALGVKTIGVTIEGVDHCYYFDDTDIIMASRFSIISNYFEAIRSNCIYQNCTRSESWLKLDVTGNVMNDLDVYSILRVVQGQISFLNLKSPVEYYKIQIDSLNTYRPCILYTDLHPSNIINNSTCLNTRVFFKSEVSDANFWDVYSYSDSVSGFLNNPPASKVIAPTMQDNIGYMGTHPIDNSTLPHKRTMYKNIHSPSTKDLTFVDNAKGVILKDRTTGSYYRLYVDSGILGVEQEKMMSKILNSCDYKNPIFFVNCADSGYSELYYCHGIGLYKLKYVSSKWCQYVTSLDDYIQCIGTGVEFASITTYPASTWSYAVYNSEIELYYTWESTYFGLGIANGIGLNERSTKRAIGTTANRPTGVVTGFIYYDIDIIGYVEWDGNSWEIYTP